MEGRFLGRLSSFGDANGELNPPISNSHPIKAGGRETHRPASLRGPLHLIRADLGHGWGL